MFRHARLEAANGTIAGQEQVIVHSFAPTISLRKFNHS